MTDDANDVRYKSSCSRSLSCEKDGPSLLIESRLSINGSRVMGLKGNSWTVRSRK